MQTLAGIKVLELLSSSSLDASWKTTNSLSVVWMLIACTQTLKRPFVAAGNVATIPDIKIDWNPLFNKFVVC